MATKQEMLNRFHSEKGVNALRTRLNTFIDFLNNKRTYYPLKHMMLGFGSFHINNDKELYGRIKELGELLGVQIKFTLKELTLENDLKVTTIYAEVENDDK